MHLISKYDYHIKKLDLTHDVTGNNPGAHLARRIKTRLAKSKISHLIDAQNRRLAGHSRIIYQLLLLSV